CVNLEHSPHRRGTGAARIVEVRLLNGEGCETAANVPASVCMTNVPASICMTNVPASCRKFRHPELVEGPLSLSKRRCPVRGVSQVRSLGV
ncbi:MAG: hypothetical protein ACXVAG_05440, partial [Vulcanimicrobiaceae bacterium]